MYDFITGFPSPLTIRWDRLCAGMTEENLNSLLTDLHYRPSTRDQQQLSSYPVGQGIDGVEYVGTIQFQEVLF